MAKPPPNDQNDRETLLDKAIGIIALLFWSLLLIEPLGITLIVGVSDIEPRPAALMLLVPSLAVWLYLCSRRAWRGVAAALLLLPFMG